MTSHLRALRQGFHHSRHHGRALAVGWLAARQRLEAHGLETRHARLLEIGCGRLYPYSLLFASTGTRIVGTDVIPLWRHAGSARHYRRLLVTYGPWAALRNVVADWSIRPILYAELSGGTGVHLRHDAVELATMDATRLALGDGQFDGCVSIAAFEHIPDVPAALTELSRVLAPGAIAHLEIHLFPSMTGGHDHEVSSHRPVSPTFQLWRHLLDPAWQPPVPLNRWRDAQFARAFADRFDLLERVVTSRRGADRVTPALCARLPDYSAEDLGTETVAYVLQNRGQRAVHG